MKEDEPEEEEDDRRSGARRNRAGIGQRHAECERTEQFDRSGDGVDRHYPSQLPRNLGHGVDDRRTIHPQLHPEVDELAEVAVFLGKGGDEHPDSRREDREPEDDQGVEQDEPGRPRSGAREGIV